jgi:hypothetical protein
MVLIPFTPQMSPHSQDWKPAATSQNDAHDCIALRRFPSWSYANGFIELFQQRSGVLVRSIMSPYPERNVFARAQQLVSMCHKGVALLLDPESVRMKQIERFPEFLILDL